MSEYDDPTVVRIEKLSIEENSTILFLLHERIKAMRAYGLETQVPRMTLEELEALAERLGSDGLWIERWSD